MSDTTLRRDVIFDGGPFPHIQRSLGLFRPVGRNVVPRAIFCVAIGWLPLVILILIQGINGHTHLYTFFTDLGVQARSLIAAPLFILCENLSLPRLNQVAQHFVSSGIVHEDDRIHFHQLVTSTRSQMNSTIAEICALLSAYIVVLVLIRYVPLTAIPPWYSVITNDQMVLSWAAIWYAYISLPLLLILLFGWIWRVACWSRFLRAVSLMPLRLIAAHPDHSAGLKFLNASLVAFMPVAFTIGVIVAGSVANRVMIRAATMENIQKTAIGLVAFVLILFAGPLLIFSGKLLRTKLQGIFKYGQLAGYVGNQFEEKWLTTHQKAGSHSLEVPDFSATTDLYGVVANVHSATFLPFEWRSLLSLSVATLLPFIPVILMMIPVKVLVKELAGLFL